ncbi:MAG: hypothetical protein Ct9H300mP7_6990 [Verrucomicrobiota bacterium]|nr:MAG: hypothetical protein Ct9H300mP7_6990 [Verrucomicrobiota bacterium]
MNQFLNTARAKGALIIHAPSSCMEFYKNHPARKRAQAAPGAAVQPKAIESWCHWIDKVEESQGYPIDHSDGGEDDDPAEHAAWAKHLAEIGRNPGSPWKRQVDLIEIDPKHDAISDSGIEIWNLLEARRDPQLTARWRAHKNVRARSAVWPAQHGAKRQKCPARPRPHRLDVQPGELAVRESLSRHIAGR